MPALLLSKILNFGLVAVFLPLSILAVLMIAWRILWIRYPQIGKPRKRIFKLFLRIYKVSWEGLLSGEEIFFTPLKTWFCVEIIHNAVDPRLQAFLVGYWASRPAQAFGAWWVMPILNWLVHD